MSVEKLLIDLVIILIAAKLGGEIAERLKQPAVLGELLAGIIVGTSVLGSCGAIPLVGAGLASAAINGQNEFLKLIAEIGAILLLFEAGLESDVEDLKKLGLPALWVAFAGVILPLGMGYGVGRLLGYTSMTSLFLGAALTATSVGITARTFSDLGMSRRPEAKIVLGAAVADDVLGLIILAVVSGMAVTAASVSGIATSAAAVEAQRSPLAIIAFALAFLVGAFFLGIYAAPFILKYVSQMRTRAALSTSALIFCFLMAALANVIGGLAPIVGAYAAGLVLSTTEHKLHIEERIKPVADIFIPIFFVMMGAAMPIAAMNPFSVDGRTTLVVAFSLTLVGVIGKILGGITVPLRGVNRALVGAGMIPRGEVGLIFASVGLTKHLLNPDQYTSIVLMVMATTFITPPILKMLIRAEPSRTPFDEASRASDARAAGRNGKAGIALPGAELAD